MVPKDATYADSTTCITPQRHEFVAVAPQQDSDSSTVANFKTDGMLLIRGRLEKQEISGRACESILSSWGNGTTKQYRVYLDKWTRRASQRNQDPNTPTVATISDFLTDLYKSGMSYSAINTARSALSAAVELSDSTLSIGEHPLIRRFVKGTYQSRPPILRYNSTWDICKVLDLLKIWSPSSDLNLKLLTLKLVMLCLLVTGQRCQSIHLMDLKYVSKTESSYIFYLEEHIKQSKPGKRNPEMVLPAFLADKRLCVMTCLDAYIAETETVRNTQNTRLFLSYTKPYHPITKNTLSRWVKYVMAKSGIDINTFRPHSTRSASTSAALRSGVPLDIIMKVAGWST